MAMPISMGSPLVENLRSARVKMNGRTGKMHGLKMVSTPAENTMRARIIVALLFDNYEILRAAGAGVSGGMH